MDKIIDNKKIIPVILLMIFFSSCRNFINQQKRQFTDLVIVETNGHYDFNDTLNRNALIGKWKSYSFWIRNDTSWRGSKSLNINYEYIFNANHVFHCSEIYEDTIINWSQQGEYKLLPDTNILYLFTNKYNDTVFHQGDTMRLEQKIIYTLNDSTLRLKESRFHLDTLNAFTEYKKY